DPAAHLAVGRAIQPLRDDGVMIVGSGMSYHNMRAFMTRGGDPGSARFDEWLRETVTLDAAERDARLTGWAHAPHARQCHPREEHRLRLRVVAGAAGEDRATVPSGDTLRGARVSAVHFG